MALLMSEAPPDEQSGDTHLSTHKGGGREQAQLLADYWAPILRGKAEGGELHVYVSAMQRCMQTVDPLMKELGATATIEPRICEVPGLCAPEDRAFYEREVFPRIQAGEEAAAREAVAAHSFSRCGLTKAQVQATYPWAVVFNNCSDGPFPETEPWYPGAWESERDTAARIAGCREWLFGLARELPPDDAVLLVSHGDTIWKLFAAIIGVDSEAVSHGTMNTSVSSVKIEPDGKLPRCYRCHLGCVLLKVQRYLVNRLGRDRLLQPHAPSARGGGRQVQRRLLPVLRPGARPSSRLCSMTLRLRWLTQRAPVAQMKKKVSGGGKQKDLGKEMGKGSPLSIGAMLAKL